MISFKSESWQDGLHPLGTLHISKGSVLFKSPYRPQTSQHLPACNLSTSCGPKRPASLFNSGSNSSTLPQITAFTQGQQFFTQKRHFSVDSIYKLFSPDFFPIKVSHDFLVYIHTLTGLPWWASIALATILLRSCITLPLAIYSSYILAQVENLQPEIRKLSHRLKIETAKAIREFGWDMEHARQRYNYSVSLEKCLWFSPVRVITF